MSDLHGAHRADVETEQATSNDGDGCDAIDVSNLIHVGVDRSRGGPVSTQEKLPSWQRKDAQCGGNTKLKYTTGRFLRVPDAGGPNGTNPPPGIQPAGPISRQETWCPAGDSNPSHPQWHGVCPAPAPSLQDC